MTIQKRLLEAVEQKQLRPLDAQFALAVAGNDNPAVALARFEEDEMVGIVRFTTDDCVRSMLCQRALKAYY